MWFYENPLTFLIKSIRSLPVLIKYILNDIGNHEAKQGIFRVFWGGVNKNEFTARAEEFSLRVLPGLVRKEAMDRFRWHIERKHECILISASIQEYIIPWAEDVGFSKVFATSVQVDGNNTITGEILDKNCYGAEKVRRIKEYLGALSDYEIYAYGDSPGDKEMLEIADYAFYRSFNMEIAYPK